MSLTKKLALAFTPFVVVVGLLSIVALTALDRIMMGSEVFQRKGEAAAIVEAVQWTLDTRVEFHQAETSGADHVIQWFVRYFPKPEHLDLFSASTADSFRELRQQTQTISTSPQSLTEAERQELVGEIEAWIERLVTEAFRLEVVLDDRKHELRAQLDRAIVTVTLTFFLIVLAAAGVTFFIIYALIAPLKRLTSWVDAVRRGDEGIEFAPSQRGDEVGRLERAFSRMVGELRGKVEAEELMGRNRLEMLKAILEGLPFPALILGANQNPSFSSSAAHALGFDRLNWLQNGTGQHGTEEEANINRDFVETLREEIRQVAKSRKPMQRYHVSEAILLATGKEERYFLPQVIPVHVENGEGGPTELLGVAMLFPDVTLLHLAHELKTNTLATVSHELKTPLTSLRLALSLLRDSQTGPLNEKQNRVVNLASNDLERLLSVIEDIVSFSRLEDATERLDRENTELAPILDLSAKQAKLLLGDAQLDMELAPEVSQMRLYLDKDAFSQAIAHLVTAVAETAKGDQAVILQATPKEPAQMVVRITLSQHTLSEEQLLAWKEPSHGRYLSRSERPGLGLMLAREIIEAHGASFEVSADENALVVQIQLTEAGKTD